MSRHIFFGNIVAVVGSAIAWINGVLFATFTSRDGVALSTVASINGVTK